MKLRREGQKLQDGSLKIKALCKTVSKAFDMFKATGKPGDHQKSGLDGSHTGDQIEDCEVIDV